MPVLFGAGIFLCAVHGKHQPLADQPNERAIIPRQAVTQHDNGLKQRLRRAAEDLAAARGTTKSKALVSYLPSGLVNVDGPSERAASEPR